MTIDEAIRARLDRFNRLWKKAVGYTFEEEPEVLGKKYEEEVKKWEETAKPLYDKYGFKTYEDFWNYLMKNGLYEEEDEDRNIPAELIDLFYKKPTPESDLYGYEMAVINEAKNIAEFIEKKAEENKLTSKEQWDQYADLANNSTYDFIEKVLKPEGYDKWNEGHSGNSGSKSVMFASALIKWRDMFPYIHGAMAELIGDKGYYDDREDVKEYIEKHKDDEDK